MEFIGDVRVIGCGWKMAGNQPPMAKKPSAHCQPDTTRQHSSRKSRMGSTGVAHFDGWMYTATLREGFLRPKHGGLQLLGVVPFVWWVFTRREVMEGIGHGRALGSGRKRFHKGVHIQYIFFYSSKSEQAWRGVYISWVFSNFSGMGLYTSRVTAKAIGNTRFLKGYISIPSSKADVFRTYTCLANLATCIYEQSELWKRTQAELSLTT